MGWLCEIVALVVLSRYPLEMFLVESTCRVPSNVVCFSVTRSLCHVILYIGIAIVRLLILKHCGIFFY